ncbi:MAG: SDR family NAD(P)-dependent oxidoreductase [Myxococcales bacterium]|nr:SDR family NAD(P)-dependent oxidoreductase [Myxococcales bacterium]
MGHVIVTGASSGIGEALALAFGAAGHSLTLVARRKEKLQALAAQIDGPCHVVSHDLSVPERATDWLAGAIEANGPVDVLINNAGVQTIDRVEQADIEASERLISLNLLSPLRLTRAVVPEMKARKTGTIVDVASMAALAPTPGMAWYSASKAGLAAASDAIRTELLGTGVHVVTVYPGIIGETAMGAHGLTRYEETPALKMQPQGTAEELARRVMKAVDKRRDRVIYPAFNTTARHLPGLTRWVMDKFSPQLIDASDAS